MPDLKSGHIGIRRCWLALCSATVSAAGAAEAAELLPEEDLVVAGGVYGAHRSTILQVLVEAASGRCLQQILELRWEA